MVQTFCSLMNEGNIFRVSDLTREIRENKNPAKISTYTVYDCKSWQINLLVLICCDALSCYQQFGFKKCWEFIREGAFITNNTVCGHIHSQSGIKFKHVSGTSFNFDRKMFSISLPALAWIIFRLWLTFVTQHQQMRRMSAKFIFGYMLTIVQQGQNLSNSLWWSQRTLGTYFITSRTRNLGNMIMDGNACLNGLF